MEREGVGWWIFLGFDLKSGCRDSGRFLMLVLDWILMLDLKSGDKLIRRVGGFWAIFECEEWESGFWRGQIFDLKSGCRLSPLEFTVDVAI